MDDEKRLREILQAARSQPRPGWERRAIGVMVGLRRGYSRLQIVLNAAVVLLVIAAMILGPLTSANAATAMIGVVAAQNSRTRHALDAITPDVEGVDLYSKEAARELSIYSSRAAEFVRSNYPKDPEMLMAAGLLTNDPQEKDSLLRQATQVGGRPVVWSAYVQRIMQQSPGYSRQGMWGVDPQFTPEEIRKMESMRRSGAPEQLSASTTAPVLESLQNWETADPNNALPTVFRMWYAYGLHKDTQALALWKEAANKPHASLYHPAVEQAVARLLREMGMDEVKAILAGGVAPPLPEWARIRSCARIALYEGRVAQIDGRPKDAVAWWNGTIILGNHMQNSSDSVIESLVGLAVQAIGASPTWKWYLDIPREASAGVGGPLSNGRMYFGKQHAFYVSQVGAEADAQVRDNLIRGATRKKLLQEYDFFNKSPLMHAFGLFGLTTISFIVLGFFVLAFIAASIVSRRKADQAVQFGRAVRWGLVAVLFMPMIVGSVLAARAVLMGKKPLNPPESFFWGIAATGCLILIASIIVTILRHQQPVKLTTAWRGSLRALLPTAIVLSALISLTFGLMGRQVRQDWVREWYSPGYSELKQVAKAIGPEWDNPRIPKDAWRAAYPPERR